MFRVLCITGKEGKTGLFGKSDISRREISFEREEILINEVSVVTKKGKIRHKVLKKLKKIVENEENVYTTVESIKAMEKNKNNMRVINYLVKSAFKKWTNINGYSLSDEPFAIVPGTLDGDEKERIFKIASLTKLVTVYNCSDNSLADEILEKTGLCVKLSNEEITENAVIYTGESLAFEDRKENSRVYDVSLQLPKEMKEYDALPMERILENALKCENGEKLFKKNKLKIGGFYREKTL